MNKWDNHKKPTWTKQDEFMAWFKIGMLFVVTYLYFHFVIMGW